MPGLDVLMSNLEQHKLRIVNSSFNSFDSSDPFAMNVDDVLDDLSVWLSKEIKKGDYSTITAQEFGEVLTKYFPDSSPAFLYERSNVVHAWLEAKSESVTPDDYRHLVGFLDAKTKSTLAKKWLDSAKSDVDKFNRFTKLMLAGGSAQPTAMVGAMVIEYLGYRFSEDENFHADHVIEFIRTLYPNSEAEQIFFMETYLDMLFGDIGNDADADPDGVYGALVLNFAKSLRSIDSSLKILTQNKYILEPTAIIEVIKEKLATCYESLSKILEETSLEDAIKPEFVDAMKHLFGQDVKLATILSFCDVYGHQMPDKYDVLKGGFIGLLQPGFLQRMRESYNPPSNKAYVNKEDHDKVRPFVPVASALPQTYLLAHAIKNIVPKIPDLSVSMAKLSSHQDPDGLQKKLHDLIADENVTQDDVRLFFEAALSLEPGDKIAEKESAKLFKFFQNSENQAKMAYLFSEPEGAGIFINLIHSLGHGCVANIGTQVNMALMTFLIADPAIKALYSVYADGIAKQIINESTEDVLGSAAVGTDIFANTNILQSHLSPVGVVNALVKELSTLSSEKCWELIKGILGEEDAYEASENLLEAVNNNVGKFNAASAELAAYLILKSKSLDEVLRSPYNDAFVAKCEKALQKPAAEEALASPGSGI
jgi:hypothetical protein